MWRNTRCARISRQHVRRNAAELSLQRIQIDLPRKICLRRLPKRPQLGVSMLGFVDESNIGVAAVAATRKKYAPYDREMHRRPHSPSPNSGENIGRNIRVLHPDYPYAGVTSSGIWLLVAGVVTTWYGHFALLSASSLHDLAVKMRHGSTSSF